MFDGLSETLIDEKTQRNKLFWCRDYWSKRRNVKLLDILFR
jgi:hypothetical protein